MVVRGSKMAKDKSINELRINSALVAGALSGNMCINPQAADASVAGTVNRPLTVSGLRWMIDFGTTAAAAAQFVKWVIWIRRKNQSIPSIPIPAPGAVQDSFSSIDENNVLVWGTGVVATNSGSKAFEGATKTQRKMQVGDQLVFSYYVGGTGTDAVLGIGTIQTFYKS